jgi:hypothetical protein
VNLLLQTLDSGSNSPEMDCPAGGGKRTQRDPFCPFPAPYSLFPVPYSLFPTLCSPFPVPYPCSLFPIPVPCSLFPIPCSLFPTRVPCSLFRTRSALCRLIVKATHPEKVSPLAALPAPTPVAPCYWSSVTTMHAAKIGLQ